MFFIKLYEKDEKLKQSIITDYINYTLEKSEVLNMYIVGGVGIGK